MTEKPRRQAEISTATCRSAKQGGYPPPCPDDPLIEKNKPFIKVKIREFYARGGMLDRNTLEDMYQEAAFAFWKFMKEKDESKFNSANEMYEYCSYDMLNAMYKQACAQYGMKFDTNILKEVQQRYKIQHYETTITLENIMPYDDNGTNCQDIIVEEFINTLIPIDRKIIRMRLAGYTQEEISKHINHKQAYVSKAIKHRIAPKYMEYFGVA